MMEVAADRVYDVVAVGGVDLDLVLSVDRLPGHGEKVMGSLIGRLPGGTVGNFACAASRLGLNVAALANVGDDEAGKLVIADYQSFGVVTEFVTVLEETQTHFTVILLEPSGERSIVVVPMFRERYDPALTDRALSQARAMYLMANNADMFIQMARSARANGTLVMIDVESTLGADRPTLEKILQWVDIASFNDAGLVASSGEPPSIEGARRLLAYGPGIIAVTLGKEGALAVTTDEAVQVPGFDVQVKDTTGAGDTFNAAFLSATLRGDPLTERLAFANAAAALSVTGLGPRGRLPTRAEVSAFIRSRNG